MTKQNRFDIDFFEFSFLVTACIPPQPIARSVFWDDVINKHYKVLTQQERDNLYLWVNRDDRMKYGLKEKNEACLLFNARYDNENQYIATCFYNGKESMVECFKWNNEYHTSKSQYIADEYIAKVDNIR